MKGRSLRTGMTTETNGTGATAGATGREATVGP